MSTTTEVIIEFTIIYLHYLPFFLIFAQLLIILKLIFSLINLQYDSFQRSNFVIHPIFHIFSSGFNYFSIFIFKNRLRNTFLINLLLKSSFRCLILIVGEYWIFNNIKSWREYYDDNLSTGLWVMICNNPTLTLSFLSYPSNTSPSSNVASYYLHLWSSIWADFPHL